MNIQVQKTTIETIHKLHNEVELHLKNAINKAIELGGIIANEKQRLGHGNFSTFLKELPFSERTARRYMLLFDNREKVAGLTFKEAYKLIGTTKTDTVSDLQEDEVCKALDTLANRAWHLQFSGTTICWNEQKYDFTLFLRECWQDWSKVNAYIRKHISDQLTIRKSDYIWNTPMPNTCWIEAIMFELCMLEADLKKRTYQEDLDNYKRTLKETDAPKEDWDTLNKLTDQSDTVFGLTLGELAWNYCHDAQWETLEQDYKNVQTVFAAFHKRLGNEVGTITEERKKADSTKYN